MQTHRLLLYLLISGSRISSFRTTLAVKNGGSMNGLIGPRNIIIFIAPLVNTRIVDTGTAVVETRALLLLTVS